MKRSTAAVAVVALILMTIAIAAWATFNKVSHNDSSIAGVVTKIDSRPNQAEDGFYKISVAVGDTISYTIDATGYMNTPLSPASQNEACVAIPKLSVGDAVIFRLPKAKSAESDYGICHPIGALGYYFTKKQ